MTMSKTYDKGLLQTNRVLNKLEHDNQSYHVRYKDGYESRSSKEAFWIKQQPVVGLLYHKSTNATINVYHPINWFQRKMIA